MYYFLFLRHSHLDSKTISFLYLPSFNFANSQIPSPSSTSPLNLQKPTSYQINPPKWSTPLPPAARPPKTAPVSVPPRPSAPVASRAPWTAAATRLLPRTLFRVPAAHAVCNSTILIIRQKQYTNMFEIGSRPAGQCTCERSVTENQTIAGETCACGSRPQGKF